MAKCNFSIAFTGSADEMVAKAKKAIADAGGSFTGDATKGSFEVSSPIGKVKGSYAVAGQTASFVIDDKPFLVSCSKIESKLKEYVGSA